MRVVGRETVRPIVLMNRSVAMAMPFGRPEDLKRGLSLQARCIRGKPGALRLKCSQPSGGWVFPATMRGGVPNLPQEPGEEHQGSQQYPDATGNTMGHDRGITTAGRSLSTLQLEVASH
ncbi:hypothetical protein [Falsiroseomonas sp. E2-1-a4]|uniref:hypothetical protein n=1 Tax=Falsiroseomonas sp. E2-1-a4 TaxID=3239299 RepID=UPI003F3D152B